jgi:hypothetical protein
VKRIAVVAAVALIAALFVALAQIPSTTTSSTSMAMKRPWERGDQYLYGHFFAHVSRVNQQAEEAEQLGMNSGYLRGYFQTTVQLTAAEAVLLNQVAADLSAQLAAYDANAKQVRTDWHVVVQRSRLNHEAIPPTPAQVRSLQPGRDALILQARDRLRQSLGDAEFGRLDSYVRSHAPWKRAAESTATAPGAPPTGVGTSDRFFYIALFRSVAHFKAAADAEASLGLPESAAAMRTLIQRRAGLTDEQARVLGQVATEYLQARAAYNVQLKTAALPYRRLTLDMLAAGGTISKTPELAAAAAPAKEITRQMDALTDAAIQRLRAELGDEGFARADAFAKRMARDAQPMASSPSGAVQGVAQ